MKHKSSLLIVLFFVNIGCSVDQKTPSDHSSIPGWAKDAMWYQIFVERFRNGDLSNDPTLTNIQGSWPHTFSQDWQVSKWTSDWYAEDSTRSAQGYYDYNIQSRRYGGDLQGVLDQLDYLEELGINAIYFNPINDAPSLHKYDARNFRHVDVNFGPDPTGDSIIIKSEIPTDPSTWKWTSADKLLLKLIEELHARNIRVILDYSWNHTGITFWAWQDILKNGEKSNFAKWYEIKEFDNPETDANEFDYTGWAGVRELPELAKVDVENRVHGKPYKGNIIPVVKQHIFNVSNRWLDPNGDGNFDDGVDGYRLDVADQIGMDFWKDYRNYVRSVNPETLLVGEIWWETWPDKMMDPRPYVLDGEIFDIVMFYQTYSPARTFFAKTAEYKGASALKKGWEKATKDIPDNTLQSMMVMSASHDAPRLLTSFYNKSKYKFEANPKSNNKYKTGKPDAETYQRVQLYLSYQFTMPGAPQIWAGDEMGMWGADDPDCRKPLWWNDLTFDNETNDPFKSDKASYEVSFNKELNKFYKKLISIRNSHKVLRQGNVSFLYAEGDLLILERTLDEDSIVTVLNNSSEPIFIPKSTNISGKDLLSDEQVNLQEGQEIPALSARIVLINH